MAAQASSALPATMPWLPLQHGQVNPPPFGCQIEQNQMHITLVLKRHCCEDLALQYNLGAYNRRPLAACLCATVPCGLPLTGGPGAMSTFLLASRPLLSAADTLWQGRWGVGGLSE